MVNSITHRQVPGVRHFVKRLSVHLIHAPFDDYDCYVDNDVVPSIESYREEHEGEDETDDDYGIAYVCT